MNIGDFHRAGKPVLVTGAHRTGTTWAGRILALSPGMVYVHEPFNLNNRMSVNYLVPDHWYTYLSPADRDRYIPVFDRIMKLDYPLQENLKRVRNPGDLFKLAYDQAIFLYGTTMHHKVLVKDPLAFFSSEWLSSRYNMEVLLMVRHPAAFCSSLVEAGWQFDFNHFLRQPCLMETYLGPLHDEIVEFSSATRSLPEQAALLWKCIYLTADRYRETHPGWLFVRHEDLSRDPVNGFKAIFDRFGLRFTNRISHRIISTSVNTVVDQPSAHGINRNSLATTRQWKDRLDAADLAAIRDRTAGVWQRFYDDEEW